MMDFWGYSLFRLLYYNKNLHLSQVKSSARLCHSAGGFSLGCGHQKPYDEYSNVTASGVERITAKPISP